MDSECQYKISTIKQIQNGWILNSQLGGFSAERFVTTEELIEMLRDPSVQ